MDVRFYPAAAGDPAGLDFAQCLGYYGYKHAPCKGVALFSVCRLLPCPRLGPVSTLCSYFSTTMII
uniref:Uncharacterized protein n=1 Tax=Ursus americanus TaxID=9643 RepID=A0A452R0E7_URSAM